MSQGLQGSLFPPTAQWKIPTEFPNLFSEKVISLDCETADPNLLTKGPGFVRDDAKVVGVALATNDSSWYLPVDHLGGGNLNKENVFSYLGDLFKNPEMWVIGAHCAYDIEALHFSGVEIKGRPCDIQVAEPLLDEERDESYSLDSLSKRYLGVGKNETKLREAAASFGVDPKSELWKLPSKYVAKYAEFDARAAYNIFKKQIVAMREDDLLPIFELESRLIRVVLEMRWKGIPINLEKASRFAKDLQDRENALRFQLRKKLGFEIDPWSGKHLQSICESGKIQYPLTPKGNPSFEGDWLKNHVDPTLKVVSEIRELNRLGDVFIRQWVFNNQHNGRVHPTWHQLKRDDGGTRTGRFSASNPNPQQVPARSDLAHLVRELFIPEKGHKWCKMDYSQQEPRLLIHYAYLSKLTGASLVRQAYHSNPKMDIYQFLADSCNMNRRDAKDATLGRCYGMGVAKFAADKGISTELAKQKLKEFDESVPFVKELANKCMAKAQERGFIKTLCGRKRHFNYWEPVESYEMRKNGKEVTPKTLAKSTQEWGKLRLQRAFTHKALNSLIQGSAADMIKVAMLRIYEDHKMIPHLTIHDELDYSVTGQEESDIVKKACETCVKLEVPIHSEMHLGEHWK